MSSAPRFQIEIHDFDGNVRRVPVASDELIIGRTDEADIQLDLATVSRVHAKLVREQGDVWRLIDLGSRDGTTVNGQQVEDTTINPGDVILISHFRLILIDQEASS